MLEAGAIVKEETVIESTGKADKKNVGKNKFADKLRKVMYDEPHKLTSLAVRLCKSLINFIGSIYSREDPGVKEPEKHVWRPTIHPLTQADFVGFFTTVTIGLYTYFLRE